jgi:hypothetical protein
VFDVLTFHIPSYWRFPECGEWSVKHVVEFMFMFMNNLRFYTVYVRVLFYANVETYERFEFQGCLMRHRMSNGRWQFLNRYTNHYRQDERICGLRSGSREVITLRRRCEAKLVTTFFPEVVSITTYTTISCVFLKILKRLPLVIFFRREFTINI